MLRNKTRLPLGSDKAEKTLPCNISYLIRGSNRAGATQKMKPSDKVAVIQAEKLAGSPSKSIASALFAYTNRDVET